MMTSKNGIELIKLFEGCKLTAYKATPGEKHYTIGYGHYGKDVKAGQTITTERAEELLKEDLKESEKQVNAYMPRYMFNQNEFDALVCFAFNIGSIHKLTDKGMRPREEIRKHWLLYNKSGGKVLEGLTKRRIKELELFNTPITADNVVTVSDDTDKVSNKLNELNKLVRDTIDRKSVV